MLFSVIRLSTNVSLWNIVVLCSGHAAKGNTNVVGEPPYGYPRPRHRFANRCITETQAIWPQEVSNFEDNDKVHHRTHYLSAYRPVSLAFPRCVNSCCNKNLMTTGYYAKILKVHRNPVMGQAWG